MKFFIRIALAFVLCTGAGVCHAEYAVAPFQADVTAPIGHPMMGGGIAPAARIDDNLMAKGIVLLGADKPIVICVFDWCELRNDAYDYVRAVMARAAQTPLDHVMLSCIHQHDAPIADFEAQRLLNAQGLKKALCDVEYIQDSARRTAEALRASLQNPIPVTHYGVGEAEVNEVASNRRVVDGEGNVSFPRTSATGDAAIRSRPIGVMDPWLKMLTFWNGDTAVAAISNYAVHPMSYYGKGGVSKDFTGHARERLQAEQPGVFQIYASGCSGDIVAGKYNDGSPETRVVLADKMYQGMVSAWERQVKHPIQSLTFRCAKLRLEPRNSEGFSVADSERILKDTNKTIFQRILAAMALSWHERVGKDQPIDVPCIDLGRVQYLVMPAESFVEYQLIAQQMSPASLVLVAGYGESAPGYIPTQRETEEGFNMAHEWLWVAPGVEGSMREAMREALGK